MPQLRAVSEPASEGSDSPDSDCLSSHSPGLSSITPEKVPGAARTVALEALYAISTGGLYVSGVSDQLTKLLSTPLRPRAHRIRSRRELPVVLLHGLAHNQSWSVKIQRELNVCGFAAKAINYQTFSNSLDQCADIVADKLTDYLDSTGAPAAHVAGHSIGGLVLRAAINRHPELASRIATGITIGTPHHGTPWAVTGSRLIPKVGRLVEELRPGSESLQILDEQTVPGSTKWFGIYSSADEVVPGQYGRLDHPALAAVPIQLHGVGHYGLTANQRSVDAVVDSVVSVDELLAARRRSAYAATA